MIEWSNPDGGSWHEASNWSPPVVPNDPQATVRIAIGGQYTVELMQDAAIGSLELRNPEATLHIGGDTRLDHHGSQMHNDGLIHLDGDSMPSMGFSVETTFVGSGTLWAAEKDWRIGGRLFGRVRIINSKEHTIGGALYSSVELVNRGELQPRALMDFLGGIVLEPSSRVRATTDQYLHGGWVLHAHQGTISLGGSLIVEAPQDFEPGTADEIAIFTSNEVLGEFASVSPPELPQTLAYRWVDSYGNYQWRTLEYSCLSDLSGSSDPGDDDYAEPDGVRDSSDFFTFLDFFANGDLRGDLTGSTDPADPSYRVPDGLIDERDFFVFLEAFTEVCP